MHTNCSKICPKENSSRKSISPRSFRSEQCESSKRMSFGGVLRQLSNGNQPKYRNGNIQSVSLRTLDEQIFPPKIANQNNASTDGISSLGLTVARNLNLLPAAHRWSRTNCYFVRPNLKISYIPHPPGLFVSIQQKISTLGTHTELVLASDLHRISFLEVPCELACILRRSYLPAIDTISRNEISSSQVNETTSVDRNGLYIAWVNLMRDLLLELALHMHRPIDIFPESPVTIMVSSGGNGPLQEQAIQSFSQSQLFRITEMHNLYGDMGLDVDNMSYEELLALEVYIGYVSTGLSEEAAFTSLKHSKYFLLSEENYQKESCSICQEDYIEEDDLGTLDCAHRFHIACIKEWLRHRNICPICKSTGLYSTGPSRAYIQSL